jgi:hypothetical protein
MYLLENIQTTERGINLTKETIILLINSKVSPYY